MKPASADRPDSDASESRFKRHRVWFTGALAVASLLFVGRVLANQDWTAILENVRAVPPERVVVLGCLVALSFLALSGYDFIAIRLAGHPSPGVGRVLRASFVGFVFSMNLGFTVLSGGAVRAFYYTRAGIPARGVVAILAHMASTFLLGWLGLFGVALLTHPFDAPMLPWVWTGHSQRLLGALLVLGLATYLVACAVGTGPRWKRFSWPLPRLPLALVQVGVGTFDACVAGAVLYFILPTAGVGFLPFMGAFLTAVFLGMASHVPGGFGVIEVTLLHLLGRDIAADDILAAMVLYRLVNFIIPLALAGTLFAWDVTRPARPRS